MRLHASRGSNRAISKQRQRALIDAVTLHGAHASTREADCVGVKRNSQALTNNKAHLCLALAYGISRGPTVLHNNVQYNLARDAIKWPLHNDFACARHKQQRPANRCLPAVCKPEPNALVTEVSIAGIQLSNHGPRWRVLRQAADKLVTIKNRRKVVLINNSNSHTCGGLQSVAVMQLAAKLAGAVARARCLAHRHRSADNALLAPCLARGHACCIPAKAHSRVVAARSALLNWSTCAVHRRHREHKGLRVCAGADLASGRDNACLVVDGEQAVIVATNDTVRHVSVHTLVCIEGQHRDDLRVGKLNFTSQRRVRALEHRRVVVHIKDLNRYSKVGLQGHGTPVLSPDHYVVAGTHLSIQRTGQCQHRCARVHAEKRIGRCQCVVHLPRDTEVRVSCSVRAQHNPSNVRLVHLHCGGHTVGKRGRVVVDVCHRHFKVRGCRAGRLTQISSHNGQVVEVNGLAVERRIQRNSASDIVQHKRRSIASK